MTSEIRVNSLTNRSGLSTVSITDTGVVVAGVITATNFSGSATGLTETPDITVNNIQSGVITATTFIGDGSGLTGVTASGSGINIKDSGSIVGVAATVDFSTNLNVSPASAGIVTVTVGDTDFEIVDKIVHTGDTDTAIRFPAADTFTVETAGSERLRISSAGLVGIGEQNPLNPLHILVDTNSTQTFTTTTNGGGIFLESNSSNGAGNYGAAINFTRVDGSSHRRKAAIVPKQFTGDGESIGLSFFTANGNYSTNSTVGEVFTLHSNGNVGIGTDNPALRAHIFSTANADAALIESTQSFATLRFKSALNTSGPTIGIDGAGGLQLDQKDTSKYISFAIGSERLRITSDGQVIAGHTSTYGGAKLSVIGDSTVTLVDNAENFSSTNDAFALIHNKNTGNVESGLTILSSGSAGAVYNMYVKKTGSYAGDLIFRARTGTATSAERLRISSDGTTTFTGQQHKFIHNNSGGVGAYLSLFNTNATVGSSTGICFGVGGSDAVLDGTDYGESQIKVYNDSGLYGNMEINLHTGANRSYLKIVGNGAAFSGASAGTEGMVGGVAFGNAGIAIDRSWYGQPGIHVFNQNVVGDTDQGTFRFHGWNTSYASYPGRSGSDFGVSLIADGMTLTSDRRRKTGITTITDALNTVSQMRGVSFTYVNQDLEPQTHMSMDNGKKLGFIAQEVIPLLPELILDSGEKAVELENGYCDRYNMDYGGVAPLLVEAIKELKAKNEVLEAHIEVLESRLNAAGIAT